MKFGLLAFLYGGPDQLMPLTSGLAAVFAFLLIFWNKVLVALGRIVNLFKGKQTEAVPEGHTGEGSQPRE